MKRTFQPSVSGENGIRICAHVWRQEGKDPPSPQKGRKRLSVKCEVMIRCAGNSSRANGSPQSEY